MDDGSVVVPSAVPAVNVVVPPSECECQVSVKARVLMEYAAVTVYWYRGSWQMSSRTKLDADRSLWTTDENLPRVGVEFRRVTRCDTDLFPLLDVRYVYHFGVTTPTACRRVSRQTGDVRVYLLDVTKSIRDYNNNNNDDDVGVTRSDEELRRFDSMRPPLVNFNGCVHRFVSSLRYPFENGYGAWVQDAISGRTVNYVNAEYQRFYEIVCRSQSPYNAYVLNYSNPSHQDTLRSLYPEHVARFDEYDRLLNETVEETVAAITRDGTGGDRKLVKYVKRDLEAFPLIDANVSDLRDTVRRIICNCYAKTDLNTLLRSKRRRRRAPYP
ncbi:37.7 kDa [Spodoptera frugiperda ascovirus 1a]|nr:37.7 kDa [Spodoptera frugiperda ascovirus 1a]CAL44665.1 37.7 kDa [Spodoptera frugiperda ascovirus 1a]